MRLPQAPVVFSGIAVLAVVALFAKREPDDLPGTPPPQVEAAAPIAAPPPPTPPAGISTPTPAPPVVAAPAWDIPDPASLPDDAFGRAVRRGRDLVVRTSSLIGPDAPDPAVRLAGNGLDCQSCHLQAGTQQYGIPLAGLWGVFPEFIGRDNEVRTLEERVNNCMERSMNGRALPVEGPEMTAILSYIRFISAPERIGQSLVGRGTPALPLPDRAADPVRGQAVYASTCAACHGADGLGKRLEAADAATAGQRYQFPPLWGPDSYNDGAGMARIITAAEFVHANMPPGTTFAAPAVSPADAFDVMAYVNTQPRPQRAGLEADYRDLSTKPVDAAYPPFAGPFPADQHRFGPWQPIQDWLRANPTAARAPH